MRGISRYKAITAGVGILMLLAFSIVFPVEVYGQTGLEETGDAGGKAGFLAGLWQLRVAIGIFAIFVVMVALMYRRRISALLALPIMAILFPIVAGVPTDEIIQDVLAEGSLMLHKTYTVAFFGGMLAIFAKERRIAETVIKYTAELAGDKPLVVSLAMMAVSTLLFTTLGGLGAIIMVGTIILPIMLSLGAPAPVAGGIFLIGISAGGMLNPQMWQFYIDTLGVSQTEVQNFCVSVFACYLLIGTVFTLVGLRSAQRRNFLAVYPKKKVKREIATRPLALLTPLVPIVLVIRLEQLLNILFKYHQDLQGIRLPWLAGAVLLLVLAFGSNLVLKKMSKFHSGWSKEILELLRPLFFLMAVITWLVLFYSFLPKSFLEKIIQLAAFWDNNFGAWEFIPAFLAALVFGLVTTWERFPARAWITGAVLFVIVWVGMNAGQVGRILASEEALLSKVASLLILKHMVALVMGLAVALALSWDKRSIQILSKSILEGAESVMPAVLLMLGIGMLLKSVGHPMVSGQLKPLLEGIVPSTRWSYIFIFTILAPLALYRGPLNIWGLGAGLAAVMQSLDRLEGAAVMGIFISVGSMQGVCDPTNTHNVWIANYLGVEVLELTMKLLPFIWFLTVMGLFIAGFRFLG
jgi:hypothetical protein